MVVLEDAISQTPGIDDSMRWTGQHRFFVALFVATTHCSRPKKSFMPLLRRGPLNPTARSHSQATRHLRWGGPGRTTTGFDWSNMSTSTCLPNPVL